VNCGLWRLQLFPLSLPDPGVRLHTRAPDLRSLAHRCILDRWIAGSASNIRSTRLTQPPPRSINSPASASRSFKRVTSLGTPDGEKTHFAAPQNIPRSNPRRTGETGDGWRQPRTKQVQGWK
jgi:hypothetical protein